MFPTRVAESDGLNTVTQVTTPSHHLQRRFDGKLQNENKQIRTVQTAELQ